VRERTGAQQSLAGDVVVVTTCRGLCRLLLLNGSQLGLPLVDLFRLTPAPDQDFEEFALLVAVLGRAGCARLELPVFALGALCVWVLGRVL
jgi:hypothetical protein